VARLLALKPRVAELKDKGTGRNLRPSQLAGLKKSLHETPGCTMFRFKSGEALKEKEEGPLKGRVLLHFLSPCPPMTARKIMRN
jgi:hypothetical protein